MELVEPAVLPVPVAPLRVPALLPSEPPYVPLPLYVPLPDALPAALPLPVALPLVEPLGDVAVLPLVPLFVPVLLPLPELLMPVLLPSLERVVLLVDPAVLPLVDPAVELLLEGDFVVLSAASDAPDKASDTAAAMASILCLTIIGTPFRKVTRPKRARKE